MDYKKMIIKSSSLTGVVMALLIIIGIFTGMFLYLQETAIKNGISIDEPYKMAYQNITVARNNLDNKVNEFQLRMNDITEADNAVQVAWNGLRGLGSALKVPIAFVSVITETMAAGTSALSSAEIPTWFITLVFIGLIAFIVFLLYSIWTGGNPKL